MDRRFDRMRGYRFDDRRRDGAIDSHAADSNAARHACKGTITRALVSMRMT